MSWQVVFSSICVAAALSAADVRKPSRTVQDLSFLAGEWRTEAWGGTGEEIWTRPENGNMIGVWRFMKDG